MSSTSQKWISGVFWVWAGAAFAAGAQVAMPPAPREGLDRLPELIERVNVVVVNVEVTATSKEPSMGEWPSDELWEKFFGGDIPHGHPPIPRVQRGIGSGFLIGADGLVVTNHHVVDQADTIRVKLVDGRAFDAKVLGRDPLTDIALLKLKGAPNDLPVARLGDSDALRVGEWVVAIGNPFGLASSVSAGIVSALSRDIGAGPYDDFLQTDAAINPGNSGGPLFNLRGEVVGINTAIVGGASGIGFAVPSNLFKSLLPQLQKSGLVTRGWMGVGVQDLTPELARALKVPVSSGALISETVPGAPAATAGLKPDDVVVELDGEKIISAGVLSRKVALKRPGAVSTLGFYRGAKKEERKVTWGTRPTAEAAPQGNGSAPNGDGQLGRLGLAVAPVNPDIARALKIAPEGAQIVEVTPGTAAERAGLQPGMVVVEANGQKIRSVADLQQVFRAAKPGSELLLRLSARGGRVLRVLTMP